MFQKLIKLLARKLTELDLPYMVIGGQAVLFYGEPRITRDIDITLGVGVERYKDILKVASELELKVLIDDPEKFVNECMVIPLFDEKSGIKVDFIFSFTPYEKQAIKRANEMVLDEIKVKVACIEDVIIHKIFAGRARDIEDVRSIILKNKSFDNKYVIKWLKEFDLSLSENFVEKFEGLLKELYSP